MEIKNVGVIGAGTMGNGIAHVFAKSGYSVTLVDIEQRFLDRGLQTITKNLDREVAKAKLTDEQRNAALARISATTDRQQLAACDFIVEAASERFEIKSELFRDLDASCRPEVILASNTSSISITKLAAVTKRPDKVIGMHFFNPVPVMKLVEVIRGLATSDETYATVKQLAEKLEKTPVEVNDAPGFVSNRVLMPSAQRSHVHGDGRRCHARSGRRGIQVGHGAPHGAADAGGLHRARRLPRHHARHALRLG